MRGRRNSQRKTHAVPAARRCGGLLLYAILVFAGIAPGVYGQEVLRHTEDLHQSIARQLVVEAQSHLARGNEETARVLLQRAHGINPADGDVTFFLATTEAPGRERRRQRIALLRHALENPRETATTEDVHNALAVVLLETGRAGEVISLLRDHVPRNFRDVERATGVLYLEAMLDAGPPWAAASLLRDMRREHPGDLSVVFMEQSRFPVPALAHLEWLQDRLLRPQAAGDDHEGSILASIVHHTAVTLPQEFAAVRAVLLEEYRVLRGESPEPLVMTLLDNQFTLWDELDEDDRATLRDALAAGDKALWELVASVSAGDSLEPSWYQLLPQEIAVLMQEMRSGEHRLIRDNRRDNMWEEYQVVDGSLARWRRDWHRDGRTERAVTVDHHHLTVWMRDSSSVYRLEYGAYPLLTEVTRLDVRSRDSAGDNALESPATAPRESLPGDLLNPHREREEIIWASSRRWVPPRPVVYDSAIPLIPADARDHTVPLETVLSRAMETGADPPGQFERQLRGADAREIAVQDRGPMELLLRELELLR